MQNSQRSTQIPNRVPPQPEECRDAVHWFVDSVGLYMGSVRGLFLSDYSEDQEALIEAAVINFKSRGVATMVISGDMLYKQAEYLFQHAVNQSPFGRPLLSKMELDMLDADVVIVKDLRPPQTPPELWYLYHHLLYPRALGQKTLLLSTPLSYDQFLADGSQCDDLEYAGRRITWEKVCWLLDGIMIDLAHFRQLRSESLPPMLKGEYFLYKTVVSRGLKPTPQYVLGDYSVDFALVERGNKLAIECDVLASLDQPNKGSFDAKRTLVLLADGWKLLRFTTIDLLANLGECADAVEETWVKGYKKSPAGRLVSGQNSTPLLELPVEDDVQRLAIINGAGPVAITGGAGTGKSTCIIRRVVYLLSQGVNPERILVISHNTDSVRALREEVETLADRPTVQKMAFFSWNELGLKLLKENTGAIRRKPPLKVEANPQRIIQRLLVKFRKDLDQLTLELAEELEEFTIASLISLYKANLVTPKHVKDKAKSTVDELVAKVYQGYEDQLQKSNKIDRDDMVSMAAQLLADNADIRARYQYQYDFVLVDEFQDATAAADLLARVLALPQDNLYIAGDEDESIFESKGALPKILSEVSVRLPNGRCYVLERNWRNHPHIVEAAIRLVSGLHNRRIAKEMVPGWEMPEGNAIIGPHLAESETLEAEWVADEIQVLLDSGRNPQDIAILYRYNRYASMVEEALFRKGIKCLTTNPDSTMVPDEVADVMAFLRLVMDPDGPKARESFERVCQLRSKEVDPKLFGTIASFAEANNLSFIKAVEIYSEAVADQSCQDVGQLVLIIRTMNHENLPPAETIALLKRTQRLNEYYKSVKVPPGVNYEPMRKLGQLEEEARKYKTVSEFVKSQQSTQKAPGDPADSEPLVYILSLHEAKGREFPVVFLTGLAEGLFPSETANDHEEERRLCYLGITRAKELLYLSYPSQFNDVPLAPSNYLLDMGLVEEVLPEPAPLPPGTIITPQMQQQAQFLAQQKATQLRAQQEDMLKAQQAAQAAAQQQAQLAAQQQAQMAAQQQAQQAQQAAQLKIQQAAQQQANFAAQQQAQIAAQQQAQLAAQQQAAQIEAQQQAQLIAQQQAQIAAQQQQAQIAAQQAAQIAAQQQAQASAQQLAQQQAQLAAQHQAELEAQHRAQQLAQQQAAQAKAQQEAAQLAAQQEAQRQAQEQAQLLAQQQAQQLAEQEATHRAHMEEQARLQQNAQQEAQQRAQQVARLREQQEQLQIAQQEAQARAEQERMLRVQEEERIKAEQKAQEDRVKEAKEEEFLAQQQLLVIAQREEAQRKARESADLIAQQEAQMLALRQQEAVLRAEQQAQLQLQQENELRLQQEAEALAAQQAYNRRIQVEQAEAQAELQAQVEAQAQAAIAAQAQAEAQAQSQIQSQVEAQSFEQEQALAQQRAQQAQQMLFQAKPEEIAAAELPMPVPAPEAPKKGKGKKKGAQTEPPKEDFSPVVEVSAPPSVVSGANASADPGLPPSSATDSGTFVPLPEADFQPQGSQTQTPLHAPSDLYAFAPDQLDELLENPVGNFPELAEELRQTGGMEGLQTSLQPGGQQGVQPDVPFYGRTQSLQPIPQPNDPAQAAPQASQVQQAQAAAYSAPLPAPAAPPAPADVPDPRDVFWSNVNNSMLSGVQEVPSTGPLPTTGYGAKARAESAAASAGPSPAPYVPPAVNMPGYTDPAEFYPDGVTVPGPMSAQLSKQFPGGVPAPTPLAPRKPLQQAPAAHAAHAAHAPRSTFACPGCSAPLEDGSRFCGECGFRLEVRITACHLCGAPLEPNSRFCGECGSQMHDKNAAAQTMAAQASMAGPAGGITPEQQRYETYLSGQKPSQQGWVTKLKKLLD